jgi:hypothetical protein
MRGPPKATAIDPLKRGFRAASRSADASYDGESRMEKKPMIEVQRGLFVEHDEVRELVATYVNVYMKPPLSKC